MMFPMAGYAQQNRTKAIFPEYLVYEGAFSLNAGPKVDDYGRFGYGGNAFAYYPNGDPSGPDDGYPGSLFGSGHASGDYITEVSIPVPGFSAAKNYTDLPRTSPLQPFANPFTGLPDYQRIGVWGLLYLAAQGQQGSGKLYANVGNDYGALHNQVHMAWLDVTLSNPNTAGFWRLGTYSQWDIGHYMFEIPKEWADQNVPGKTLACGRMRNWGAEGPNLFACAPWENGNPPLAGDTIDGTPLMHFTGKSDKGFTVCSWYKSGAWLTYGQRSAVVMFCTQNYSLDFSYFSGPFGAGMYPTLLFYDPADLSEVVQGSRDEWDIRWYARKNLDFCFIGEKIGPRGGNLNMEDNYFSPGGMAYDREHGRLYVAQTMVRTTGEPQPVIHVFRIDTTAASGTGQRVDGKSTGTPVLSACPNPFNPSTRIMISAKRITDSRKLRIAIYTVQGQFVQALPAAACRQPAGYLWNASNLPSGLYVICAKIDGRTLTKTVTLLK
ncbi:MAG: hypothetical protein A2487_04820 [Candidatus Raymondbacteria bacterium RifOxyC12_full_50_8]|uniref:Secretion system C-terminal sorting domain-containing protein n=1 Tax=Candidatus Raymondbacteria bacterium RIFOXYD12_FULL_49_13 TaxID=1817890 RepID=A0A1F7F6L1_UNCRA|nr:MAG: hypothetical protein A2350_01295 [Candidatus Raymondbacteria bacterium RifOxyB12_full_50_8]OGJ93115.1 MAG: hypothetical protein A2248_13465 [Candidatus Raymondbacteria bacterium RIFOXYA2_FULL_49_16]OGJ94814.1 MAG: hypothetical protein A2487_04820 [Candidatus Raymondbacteria bacterium RifOxyC12_full_50_8]OGK02212.1 MAG: hypothetical protein A2519_16155 [Candidatus Raymondbacteria bacterium RIFOXYD12_FULL_49_13]OGP45012.1 MAG: hypothetical protein A2324_15795 [Candidatus Raymondbacteria b